MSRIWATLCRLSLALWLGGLVMLVVTMILLFRADQAMGQGAAPVVFGFFQNYQLALAVITVVMAALWYIATRRHRLMNVLIPAAGALGVSAWIRLMIAPQMDRLRSTGGEEWDGLHRLSEMLYGLTGILVLVAFLAAVIVRPTKK